MADEVQNKQEQEFFECSRPKRLNDFIGHDNIKNNLKIFIESSKVRNTSLDHILFYGPPGLGKTTLASIIAKELDVNMHSTSGVLLNKSSDIAAVLTSLGKHDVFFIDEIHRIKKNISELLYPAMEDSYIDVIVGSGMSARSIKIDIPKFTLVGATTRASLLSKPLLDRFSIKIDLDFYNLNYLIQIVDYYAKKIKINCTKGAIEAIATRSRMTPRVSISLLKRIRDFAIFFNTKCIDEEFTISAMNKMNIDVMGLNSEDRKYIDFIGKNYQNRPVGVDTISAAVSDDKKSIEEIVEPFLIKLGLIQKTSKGRVLTANGYEYFLKYSS